MALTVMWTCVVVLLILNFQLYQTSDIQKVSETGGDSEDSMLVHLMSFVVKHAEKINDLEHKLEKQEEKHDEELKQIEEKHVDLEYKLQKQQEKHSDDIEKIKNDHADEMKIIKGSLATKQPITPVVGFHVALDHNQASGGKVAFNRILSNYGNGWSIITHTFTVPTKGLYFLTMSVPNEGSAAMAYLRRGLKNLQAAYADGGHRHNSETTSTVLLLDAGEHIYAQHAGNTIFGNSNLHTHFAGFLI